jgi:hypothetical protein
MSQNLIIAFLATLALLSSCKSRDFNTALRSRIDNPDAKQSPCHEIINPKAPYTPEILIEQLTSALNQSATSKTFEKENFRDLLFADDVETAAKGKLNPEILSGNSCTLVRAINESMNKPAHFYWLTGNGRTSSGGMAIYKGDVFAEGFYRNRSVGVDGSLYPRKRYSQEELLGRQPWFEWSPQSKKFAARLGSPATRLMAHISSEQGSNALTLHRGTNTKYADKVAALATLNSFLFSSNTGGIFSTPSYEKAKGWANPVVLTSRINPKILLDAFTQQKSDNQKTAAAYVGIEFDYVEFAFLYSPGDTKNIFFDNVTNKCVVSDKAQGSDASFAKSCQ